MLEISLFADESGECGAESKYYLLTLVFHEQHLDISRPLEIYTQTLAAKGLPDIPMHASPLMNGHDAYAGLDIQTRKQLFQSFFTMLQHLPIRYHTFAYRKSDFPDKETLISFMKRDLVNFVFDRLTFFQRFDKVKVYYDDGQRAITRALHDAVEYALSTEAIVYKNSDPSDYRLAQAADLLCTFELTALKYEARENGKTDERFFGSFGNLKKNYLKKIRRKLL